MEKFEFWLRSASGVLSLLWREYIRQRKIQIAINTHFKTPTPTEQRIDNLLSLLTIEEKISCLGTNPACRVLASRPAVTLKAYMD